eukprot:4597046-Pleurochrysis_carterae.AAC.1
MKVYSPSRGGTNQPLSRVPKTHSPARTSGRLRRREKAYTKPRRQAERRERRGRSSTRSSSGENAVSSSAKCVLVESTRATKMLGEAELLRANTQPDYGVCLRACCGFPSSFAEIRTTGQEFGDVD